jgi:hypothetical protein
VKVTGAVVVVGGCLVLLPDASGAGQSAGAAPSNLVNAAKSPEDHVRAAEADQAKADQAAQHAAAEDAKAHREEKRAESDLERARSAAEDAVVEQTKANQERQQARTETDPTTAAQLQAAAANDAQLAASDQTLAAEDLKRGQAELADARRDEAAAEKDREQAEKLERQAKHEQQQAQKVAEAEGKILICHATSSAKNPHVEIEVDRNGLNGHWGHAGDLIPAPPGGCPRASSHGAGKSAHEEADLAARDQELARKDGEQAVEDAAQARKENALANSLMSDSRSESSRAEADRTKARSEEQAAEVESDPTKAAQLREDAAGDTQLASSEQLLSQIDKSLAAVERALAKQDSALAKRDHALAEEEKALAEREQERAQEMALAVGALLICHATGEAKRAYVELEVREMGLGGHGDDAGDIIPAPADGCPTSANESAVRAAEAHDARTTIPLAGGPLQGDMSANETSVVPGETVRLLPSVVNPRTKPARAVEICAAIPPGFSLVSAGRARLVRGAECLQRDRIEPMSAVAFPLYLRLNRRAGGPSHVRVPLVVSVGPRRAPLAGLRLALQAGGPVLPFVPGVTG